jgi:hypothetical protein
MVGCIVIAMKPANARIVQLNKKED